MTTRPAADLPPGPLADAFGGAEVRLPEAVRGGPALLFVYKADCPATAVAAPVLPRFAALPGLALLAISQDEPARLLGVAAPVVSPEGGAEPPWRPG